MDEPVAGLDPKVSSEMYELIQNLNKERTTIIMISHDIHAAIEYANKILHVGNSVFFGTKDDYISSEIGKRFINLGDKDNG